MKAECTWGDGPDVLLILDGSELMLYESPSDLHKAVDGYVRNGSIDLTLAEAESLSRQLLKAIAYCKELDTAYKEVAGNLAMLDKKMEVGESDQ